MSKLPSINIQHKICVICEGYEDYHYFSRLMEFNVWSSIYEFIPINAKSASNIFARYQDAYNNDKYEVVLIFCDTDKAPYREYKPIKENIDKFHGIKGAHNKIIIYANPCTMQIILSHFGDVSLKKQGKKTNAHTILEFTGVENYDAHEDQIKTICRKIYRRTYPQMKNRIQKINLGDKTAGSTNFIEFLDRFESKIFQWIADINEYLANG